MITVNSRADFLKALIPFLPQNPFCVELGVLEGDFSKMMLDVLIPSHLSLIDPYETGGDKYSNGFSSAYSNEEQFQKILKRFNDNQWSERVSIIRDYSYKVVSRFPDNYINLVYHDASHLYHDLKRDLNEWLPKMKDNSIVAGHDYVGIDGFGVIPAVNEFMEEHGLEMILFNQSGGDWALKKKL